MTERLDTDVAIIGGGIVGSSAALFLRRFGLRVVLLERGLCGAAASGVNYGGVRVQGRSLSQLPLALRSRQLWHQLPDLIGIDGEYLPSGHLKLARTDDDLARLECYARLVDGHGLDLQLISGHAFRQRYPWLGRTAIGASWCPGDGHANPRLVSPAFARAARTAGAVVIEHCEVTELGHDGQHFTLGNGQGLQVRAPRLLNCAGAWCRPGCLKRVWKPSPGANTARRWNGPAPPAGSIGTGWSTRCRPGATPRSCWNDWGW